MNTVIPDLSYIQEYKLLLMAKERQNLRKDFHNYLLERQWIDKNKLTPLGHQKLQYYTHKLQLQLYFILDDFLHPELVDIELQLGIEDTDNDVLAQLQEIAIAENLLIVKSGCYEINSSKFSNAALWSWRNKLEKDFKLTYKPS